ncbi:hypothetical protein [Dethiosulfatarculus sandiegensis]|uniref:hypothetical protein n=1 Tax=Dethiosulfatarculus sandiegensis TaxID=1429043 RepID=UPI0012E14BE5|nr:hypothetical protein [Dethiosulfatarculus sandiegensis]
MAAPVQVQVARGQQPAAAAVAVVPGAGHMAARAGLPVRVAHSTTLVRQDHQTVLAEGIVVSRKMVTTQLTKSCIWGPAEAEVVLAAAAVPATMVSLTKGA